MPEGRRDRLRTTAISLGKGYDLVATGVDRWIRRQEDARHGTVCRLAGIALQGDGAAVLVDDAAADPEAQSGSSLPFGGKERLEQMTLHVRRNA